MLAMLRTILDSDATRPDGEMDMSGELLASMDLGVKSVTWERDKQVAAKDTTVIQLPVALQPYWGYKGQAACWWWVSSV